MNILDLVRRNDPNMPFYCESRPSKCDIDGKKHIGLTLKLTSGERLFSFKKPLNWYPIREKGTWSYWGFRTFGGQGNLRLTFKKGNQVSFLDEKEITANQFVYPFKDLKLQVEDFDEVEISFSTRESSFKKFLRSVLRRPSRLFLAVSEAMDRRKLMVHCQGKGVEVGPGHNPFLKVGEGFDVKYLEQHPIEKWAELYGDNKQYVVSPALWKHYIIGEAHNIPVDDGSLNYIFSSHVFEHLYNPIGIVEHWLAKLASGGKIVAVVPAIEGCKDYVAQPSALEELIAEYATKSFEPTLAQYERYSAFRAMADSGEELMRKRRSIHVHFYSHDNMKEFLEWMKNHFGLRNATLIHRYNNKDFHFILEKN